METNTYTDRPDGTGTGTETRAETRAGMGTGRRSFIDIARQELMNLKADLNDMASRVSSLSRSDFEAARDRLMESRDRLMEGLGASKENAKFSAREYADTARTAAREAADNARVATREYADSARQGWDTGLERTTGFIRERPLQSLALAAGIGLLLGACINRR